ncbi:hypothetical protein BCR44DRAFT_1512430 [Catenaria anguillulae PL171]|uniref:RBR-type E3 ubiquitin transferase n=1 Tax=Catenaria anguillulae PL171 TaxID=765915 RepID=A0A1Y2HSD6_9FUNG|nr:hypothetical protein BCR44DRAFT_1512430 [Catenaria anguillulae PL171]
MSANANFDAQYDELAALAAIFADSDKFEFSPLESADDDTDAGIGWQGHLLIDPAIPVPPLNVTFAADDGQHGTTVVAVQSLPNIELHFSLPAEYPTTAVTQLQMLSDWAPFAMLADMTAAAERTAQACLAVESPALFDVYEAVVQVWSTYLSSLADTDAGDGLAALRVDSREALKLVRDHDQSAQAAKLASEPFTCLICLETHPGESAVVLPECQHRFCRSCLVDFFTVLINEGMARKVKCPHPDCSAAPPSSSSATPVPAAASSSSEASDPTADVDLELASATHLLATHPIPPWFLDSLLGADLTSKFTTHYLSRAYASDPTMHWCPVAACGGPARGHSDTSTYAKLATCLRCQFSFCIHCSRAYHGSAQHCHLKNADEVVGEYFAAMELATQTARDRQLAPLFVKYGRTVVEALAKKREAEMKTMQNEAEGIPQAYMAMVDRFHRVDFRTHKWVRDNATACPKCGVRVIRTGGCAHMTCAICSESFCYHCGEVLGAGSHYSVPGTKCFRRMFD